MSDAEMFAFVFTCFVVFVVGFLVSTDIRDAKKEILAAIAKIAEEKEP